MQALQAATTPTLTVCLRKAFGLAWPAMNGANVRNQGLYSWPGAEIGFMDPEVGVNVAYARQLEAIPDPEAREKERARLVQEVAEATSPYEAGGTMRIDEMIDPAATRRILAEDLGLLANRLLSSVHSYGVIDYFRFHFDACHFSSLSLASFVVVLVASSPG